MKKLIKKRKLGRKASHRRSLKRNLLRSLVEHGYVRTTTPKAKELKDIAQKFFSVREFDLETIRRAHTELGSDKLVEKFRKYVEDGNTKISIRKVGFRPGDNAEMSRVSIVGADSETKDKK